MKSEACIAEYTSKLKKYFGVKLRKEFCPTASAKCCKKYLNDPLSAYSVARQLWYHYRTCMQIPLMEGLSSYLSFE